MMHLHGTSQRIMQRTVPEGILPCLRCRRSISIRDTRLIDSPL